MGTMSTLNEQHTGAHAVAGGTICFMPRPRTTAETHAKKQLVQTGLRLTQAMLDKLDEIAAAMNAADPYAETLKADLMRDAIRMFITKWDDEHRVAPRAKAAKK
jgi:hypothetical protein